MELLKQYGAKIQEELQQKDAELSSLQGSNLPTESNLLKEEQDFFSEVSTGVKEGFSHNNSNDSRKLFFFKSFLVIGIATLIYFGYQHNWYKIFVT
jgi:hypothetical protein